MSNEEFCFFLGSWHLLLIFSSIHNWVYWSKGLFCSRLLALYLVPRGLVPGGQWEERDPQTNQLWIDENISNKQHDTIIQERNKNLHLTYGALQWCSDHMCLHMITRYVTIAAHSQGIAHCYGNIVVKFACAPHTRCNGAVTAHTTLCFGIFKRKY